MATNVSIIVPVYNVEEYLEDCLESIINQTYKDIEIIIVNDGSTDSSADIIDKYANRDFRIIVVNQPNKGLSGARNAGMDRATGEYLLFVDSDDYLRKDCVERLYQCAQGNLDIVLYGADIFSDIPNNEIYIHEKDGKIWDRTTKLYEKLQGKELFMQMVLCKKFMSSIPIQFFRRTFIEENCIRFTEGYICEDFAFSFAAMIKAEKVMCIEDKLYFRRVRPNSIRTSSQNVDTFLGRFVAYINVLDYMPSSLEDSELHDVLLNYTDQLLHNAIFAYQQVPEKEREKVTFGTNIKYEIFFRKIILDSVSQKIPNYNYSENGNRKKVVVFGAGLIGEHFLNKVGADNVLAFVDNFKKGSYCDKPIISVQEYVDEYLDYDIVIATRYYKEIAEQLKNFGIKKMTKYVE